MTEESGEATSAPGGPEGSIPPGSAADRILRQQERIRADLLRLRTELDSSQSREVLRGLRQGGKVELAEAITVVLESVEDAIRAVRNVEGVLRSPPGKGSSPYPDLPTELPLRLRHFLDERRRKGRLEWGFEADSVRGWVLRWKEYDLSGEVRGSGRLYERPHSWIHD